MVEESGADLRWTVVVGWVRVSEMCVALVGSPWRAFAGLIDNVVAVADCGEVGVVVNIGTVVVVCGEHATLTDRVVVAVAQIN